MICACCVEDEHGQLADVDQVARVSKGCLLCREAFRVQVVSLRYKESILKRPEPHPRNPDPKPRTG